jgi:hypothetical protein
LTQSGVTQDYGHITSGLAEEIQRNVKKCNNTSKDSTGQNNPLAMAISTLVSKDTSQSASIEERIHKKVDIDSCKAIYIYYKLTEVTQNELAEKLQQEGFRKDLDVDTPLTQSDVSRIINRLPEEWMEEVLPQLERIAVKWQGTKYETYIKTLSADEFIYKSASLTPLNRELRRRIYPKIRLGCDKEPTENKDRMLRLYATAAAGSTQLQSAEDSLSTNPSVSWRDKFTAGYVQEQMKQYTVEQISHMSLEVNTHLLESLKKRGYLTQPLELAIDTTQWSMPYYGDFDGPYIHNSSRSGNHSKEWRYITISVVGTDTPLVLRPMIIHSELTAGELAEMMLKKLSENIDIHQVYFDSEFYQEVIVETVEDIGAEYIIQGKKSSKDSREISEIIKGEKEAPVKETWGSLEAEGPISRGRYPVRKYGIGSLDSEGRYLVGAPSLKRERRTKDPTERKAVIFYTNRDIYDKEENHIWRVIRDFRRRWGIETSLRILSEEFMPKISSHNPRVRAYYFALAAYHYNLWTVANAIHADEKDVDLSDRRKPFGAFEFMKSIEHDEEFITVGEEPLPSTQTELEEKLTTLEEFVSYS